MIGAALLYAPISMALPFSFQAERRERVPADQISFALREGGDFCFVEIDEMTDASVLIDFETKAGVGSFAVRKSANEVDYILADPVKYAERWQENGISKTRFKISGRYRGGTYDGALTILARPGVSDGIALEMSRNGKSLKYQCGSDFSEEELSK